MRKAYIVLPCRFSGNDFEITQVDIPEEDTPPVFDNKIDALDKQIYLNDNYPEKYSIFELRLMTEKDFEDFQV